MTKARTNADNVTADISGITAGTGLSGGGASGAVTLAIDTATTADLSTAQTLTNKTLSAASNTLTGVINNTLTTTTGDIIYASAANTPARLAIGSAGQVLTVSGGLPSYATPAGGGGMTSLASGNLSTGSNTLSLTSISGSYNDLRLIVRDIYPANNGYVFQITVNAVADYDYIYDTGGTGFVGASATFNPYYDPSTNTNDENFIILDFKDYTNTDSDKSIASFYHYNSTRPRTGEIAVVWGAANTTSAITTITLTIQAGGGNWGAAGSYVLYGIK